MRRYNNLLWEDREQQEYRAAKARFFRLLTIFIALLIATAIVAISNLDRIIALH